MVGNTDETYKGEVKVAWGIPMSRDAGYTLDHMCGLAKDFPDTYIENEEYIRARLAAGWGALTQACSTQLIDCRLDHLHVVKVTKRRGTPRWQMTGHVEILDPVTKNGTGFGYATTFVNAESLETEPVEFNKYLHNNIISSEV